MKKITAFTIIDDKICQYHQVFDTQFYEQNTKFCHDKMAETFQYELGVDYVKLNDNTYWGYMNNSMLDIIVEDYDGYMPVVNV